MKKLILPLAVIFITMSSFTTIDVNTTEEFEQGVCEQYAEFYASVVVDNGGNYFSGYFGAYADCLDTLGVAGLAEAPISINP